MAPLNDINPTLAFRFVASLAVADLTLGIVVMPFSLAQEVMGYWVFGEPWCQGWTRTDRLASQHNIY